jgi:nucleoside-diphosphate-sugar epimerase
MSAPHLFCFGLGYVAQALAGRLRAKGWTVSGTVRDASKAAALAAQGIDVTAFADEHPLPEAALTGVTHILLSAPPDEHGDPAARACGEQFAAVAGQLAWIGYLSTTGVYGDRGGGWVDESTPVAPSSQRSRWRVDAEKTWLDFGRRTGAATHIFRLSGIYGPGRSAIDALKAGTAKRVAKPGQVFARIHVDDIASVLEASIARPAAGAIYNLADDEPAAPADVVTFAADLLGVPPPPLVPFDDAMLTPMSRSFFADNRRVRNDRIKRELGVSLRYPTYREGLRAIASIG